MTMVERVARVLADGKPVERWHMRQARAVIEEMRQPTEAMLDAGQVEYAGESHGEDCNLELDSYVAEKAYRAMIDAAILEQFA